MHILAPGLSILGGCLGLVRPIGSLELKPHKTHMVSVVSLGILGPGSSYKWGEITPINSIDVPSKKQVSHVFCYFVSWVIQLHFIRLQLPVQLLDRLDLLSRDMRTEMRSMSSRRFVGRFGRFGGWSMLQLFGVWGGVAGDDHVS